MNFDDFTSIYWPPCAVILLGFLVYALLDRVPWESLPRVDLALEQAPGFPVYVP